MTHFLKDSQQIVLIFQKSSTLTSARLTDNLHSEPSFARMGFPFTPMVRIVPVSNLFTCEQPQRNPTETRISKSLHFRMRRDHERRSYGINLYIYGAALSCPHSRPRGKPVHSDSRGCLIYSNPGAILLDKSPVIFMQHFKEMLLISASRYFQIVVHHGPAHRYVTLSWSHAQQRERVSEHHPSFQLCTKLLMIFNTNQCY